MRRYLAVAISQPGYFNSISPAGFCGPFTQHAVSGVIAKLRAGGYLTPKKAVIEGISRGSVVAGLVAAYDPSIAGIVLNSGLYASPLPFVKNTKSMPAVRARWLLLLAGTLKATALILNGARDDRTEPDQARRFADEIRSHGGSARTIIYPQFGHQISIADREAELTDFSTTSCASKVRQFGALGKHPPAETHFPAKAEI